MADKVIVSRDKLVDIADRIRNQGFTESQLTLDEMGQEISKIPISGLVDRSIQQFNNNRVSSVGSHAFYGCSHLENVNVPEATRIENSAFNGCLSLKTALAPKAQSVGNNAFDMCQELEYVDLSSCVEFQDNLFKGVGSASHALTVNAPNVETLGATVFEGSGLTEANFPKLTEVPADTFSGCVDLQTADVSSATRVYERAFKDCEKLSYVDLSSVVNIDALAFSSAGSAVASLTLSDMPELWFVEDEAFINSGLTRLVLTSYPLNLGERVFSHCVKLKYVEIQGSESNTVQIRYGDFEQCCSLEVVKLGNCSTINEHAFYKCEKLEKIDMGIKTYTISSNSFQDCHGLKAMIFRGPNPERLTSSLTEALTGCYFMLKEQHDVYNPDGEIGYFYVPREYLDKYTASNAFKNFVDQIRVIEDYPEICEF